MAHICSQAKCKHQLSHCKNCDAVYCKKCSKEWSVYGQNWTYTSAGTTAGTGGTYNYPTRCTHN